MSSSSNDGCASAVYVVVVVLIFGGGLLWKIFAPQSGLKSRWGGKAVQLDTPKDCKKIITLGKTKDTKYVIYETHNDSIKMKEFSDMGILEAEYEMKQPTTPTPKKELTNE